MRISIQQGAWIAFSILSLFIGWIIYQANTGEKMGVFLLVEALPMGDKMGHLWLYGALAFLLNLSLNLREFSCYRLRIYRGSLLVLLFAIAEEISQKYFALRTQDIGDVAADLVGIFLAEFLLRRKTYTVRTN